MVITRYDFDSVFQELEYIWHNDGEITSSEFIDELDRTIIYAKEELQKLIDFRKHLD